MNLFLIIILLCTRCAYGADQLNKELQECLNVLDQTACAEDVQYIIKLIQHGANPNYASKKNGNIRIVHLLSAVGNITVLKWLLDHNANPQLTDAKGWNAFTYAQHCIEDPNKRKAVIDLLYTSPVAPIRHKNNYINYLSADLSPSCTS